MKPTTKEIVKSLIGCVYDTSQSCDKCVAAGKLTRSCSAELILIAADRLEELEAKQPRWIPVAEPPNKQERVWIYYKNWAGKWLCNVGWWSGEAWYHYDDTPGQYGWEMAHEVPTHWMPLPERPKEECL